jgi:hypothetical protein
MNFLLRKTFGGFMFHPPSRLMRAKFQADDTNVLVRSVSGDMIHCQLTCPFDKPTSINDYKSTSSIMLFMIPNCWTTNFMCNIINFSLWQNVWRI